MLIINIKTKEVDEQFRKLFERRLEIITILITSVVMALLVNLLTFPLEIIVERFANFAHISKESVYLMLAFLLIACVFFVGHFYFNKTITYGWGTILLLNKDSGIVYPFDYSAEYSIVGTLALKAYLRDVKRPLFHERSLSLKSPLLRDLLEVFIVDWFLSTTLFKTELLSGFSRPKIRYPKLGKKYKILKTHNILAMFGDNRFTKYLDGEHPIMFSESKLPEKISIACKRYKDSTINLESDEEPLQVPLASELQIRGSRFTPLKNSESSCILQEYRLVKHGYCS